MNVAGNIKDLDRRTPRVSAAGEPDKTEVEKLLCQLQAEKRRNETLVQQSKADHEKYFKMAQMSKFLAFRAIEVLRAAQDRQVSQAPLVSLISQIAHQTKLLAMGLSAKLGSVLPKETGSEIVQNVNEIKKLADETAKAAEKINRSA